MSVIESSSVAAVPPTPSTADIRWRWLAWGVALLLLIACGWLRFYGLSERGLYGSDVVYYTNLAELWSEGERVHSLGGRREAYRPVVFTLYAAAIDVFGFADDSIKKLNAGLDILNILLVFGLGYLIAGRRAWPACLAAFLYATLPLVLYICRTELTHTISTFFTLLFILLALLGHLNRHRRSSYCALIGSGFCAGLATLSHEELLFAAAGLMIWLAAAAWQMQSGPKLRRLLAVASTLALFLLPLGLAVSGMVIHHWDHAATLASSWLSEGPSGAAEAVEEVSEEASVGSKIGLQSVKAARLLWNATVATSSILIAYLVLLLMIFLLKDLVEAGRKKEPLPFPMLVLLPPIVVGTHVFLFAIFFPYLFPRLFLPLIPLFLIFVTTLGARRLERWPRWPRRVFVVAIVFLALGMNLDQFSRRQSFMARDYSATWVGFGLPQPFDPVTGWAELKETSYRKSWAREIFEVLGDRVDARSRLLVTSSLMYPHPARRELQVGYYFGDDAIYLFDHHALLEELLDQHQIRWVLFTAYRADRRFLKKSAARLYLGDGRWSEPRPTTLGVPYGLDPGTFNLGLEYQTLRKFLEARGARPIHQTGTFARGEAPSLQWADESSVIYQLPPLE